MKLNYNEKELQQLLKDFHHLTGMTLTLYDPEGEWIFSYPAGEQPFCNCCRQSFRGMCHLQMPCRSGRSYCTYYQRWFYHRIPYDGAGFQCRHPRRIAGID